MLALSQQEVADLLDVPPGSQVLEVGYGSGALLRSLRRVTRPGGRVLIAWPGGRNATFMVQRIALPDRTLSRIEQELGELFTGVARHELDFLTAFTATR